MIFDNQLELQRLEKAAALKEIGINPYPHFITKESSTAQFAKVFGYIENLENQRDETKTTSVCGRIKLLRHMGKAAFAKIEDSDGALQIYFSKESIGEENFNNFKKLIEVGDIIKAVGYPFLTKTGELSLHAQELEIATKSIVPLPEKFHGLTDMELRYRQRYLDMIMNPQVKDIFKTRSRIVSMIRRFFEMKGFLEVETPMMHPIAGGANARPFVTHHNALGVERYLRIAPELYLKRLVVGGLEAVFEINRNFRNEGMDHTHNPEFTMIEFYWAYHNYFDLMKITEELFEDLLSNLELPTILPYGEYSVNLATPFKKVTYRDSLIEIGGVPSEILDNKEKILAYLDANGVRLKNRNLNLGQLWAELFDAFVESKLIDPTFVTDFPVQISPLARRSDENPNIAQRFELFICGKEIGNGFNELNDPIDQYERFAGQLEAKEAGDDEAHEMDEDYVRALGFGMPPTAGQGIGIDRLVMLLTNQHSIRDVLLFPAMKPIKKDENKAENNNNEKEEK